MGHWKLGGGGSGLWKWQWSWHFHLFSFPPPLPPPAHFYWFSSSLSTTDTKFLLFPSTTTTTTSTTFLLFSILRPLVSFVFSPRYSIKDCQLPSLVQFVAMSRVVNKNRGFLQLLADCPAHQRRFLLKTATPQQLHALVQVLYNILMGHISISKENKRILQTCKDDLLDLARPNVPYKTKKRVLVQEGSDCIEDLLVPVVSSLGFLML